MIPYSPRTNEDGSPRRRSSVWSVSPGSSPRSTILSWFSHGRKRSGSVAGKQDDHDGDEDGRFEDDEMDGK